jgi:transcriptional regulator with XRE-family HTH domain
MQTERHRQWTGKVIRQARERKGWTQTDLALAVTDLLPGGRVAHQTTISRWERGEVTVSVRYRPALVAALGVDRDLLFRLPEEMAA